MAPLFVFLALIIQSSFTFAEIDDKEEITSRAVLNNKLEIDDEVVKDFHDSKIDWMDMFTMPGSSLYPTSSATLMAQATNSDKSLEEQLEDIKEMANKITLAIQSEMANLLSYALVNCEKDENNETRKKRSVESPLDSTQLVMRLLKHIKSNNEYQNIAIEKMMTAQEIADKYGIEFNPDPEMLSDLAVAANEQAKEMTSILKDAIGAKNVTKEQVQFVPIEAETCPLQQPENSTYFVYSVHAENPQPEVYSQYNPFQPYEYQPEQIHVNQPVNHAHHPEHAHYNYYYPYEPEIPQHHCPPVTPKPTFYDSVMAITPADFYPYCYEPVTTTTTIVLPIEEMVEPEPELIGEEYEETVTSKVIVDHDEEPGSATVNHVMTYTLSEKAHFRTPQIEKLPQQMQYTFFLM